MEKKRKNSPALYKAVNKYRAKAYDRLNPVVKKGKKADYELAAKSGGYPSLNAFIERTLDDAAEKILGRKPGE